MIDSVCNNCNYVTIWSLDTSHAELSTNGKSLQGMQLLFKIAELVKTVFSILLCVCSAIQYDILKVQLPSSIWLSVIIPQC